jgi:hypothetical protein
MLSILVCHSYFLRLDQKQVARAKPYPPLDPCLIRQFDRPAPQHGPALVKKVSSWKFTSSK